MYYRHIISIIVIILIVLYVYDYKRFDPEYQITQTYLDTLSFDLIRERHPILIYDPIVDPEDIIKSFFKYQYLFQRVDVLVANQIYQNSSKYQILWCNDTEHPIQVDLINPNYKNFEKGIQLKDQTDKIQYITIKLRDHQVLIVPTHWSVHANVTMQTIYLDGVISTFAKHF